MTTILDVLEKGTAFLAGKGIEDARLNMEHLVADELDLKRMDLYLRFDQPLPEDKLTALREKLRTRSQRFPLQHITGKVHFYQHEFRSDSRALIPRPETEELVELSLGLCFLRPARILDLGCGSGAIGLSLAKALGNDCRELVLADLSTEALALCKENRSRLEIDALIIQSDLFSAIDGPFDLIVANLPYIGEDERPQLSPEVLHDPESALFSGPDGLDALRLFCQDCPDYLAPGGWVALEVGHQQGETVRSLLEKNGLNETATHSDLTGIPRFPIGKKATS